MSDINSTLNSETTIRIDSKRLIMGPKVSVRLLYEGERGVVQEPEQEIESKPVIIGRIVGDDGIRLSDPSVSRQHARLWRPPGAEEVALEDMSTNGTFVNGQRLGTAILKDGDIIRVGNSFLLIRIVATDEEDFEIDEIVGDAPGMMRLRSTIAMVAPTLATVLVIGESGTGKELVAAAVHRLSKRPGPFVPVNCAAIPATLAESQLFGHVAGSFTGAQRDHTGFFRMAKSGTLFLDEVGELPMEIQPKLLRVLEDRAVTPVGSVNSIPLDIRIVAATNIDLEEAASNKRFRGDLYARLAELTIHPPPLRDRREDILTLFEHGFGRQLPQLSPNLVEMLLLHTWPYNVRELFKVAVGCRIQAGNAACIETTHLQHRLRPLVASSPPPPNANRLNVAATKNDRYTPTAAHDVPENLPPLTKKAKEPIPQKEEVEQALIASKGNISQLSRDLGRSRRQIYRYLKMYKLDFSKYRD